MGTSEKTIRKMGLIVFTISTLAIADVNGQVILNDMSAQSLENGPKRLLEDTSSQVLELGGKRLLNDGFFTHGECLHLLQRSSYDYMELQQNFSVMEAKKEQSDEKIEEMGREIKELRNKIKIMDNMLQNIRAKWVSCHEFDYKFKLLNNYNLFT